MQERQKREKEWVKSQKATKREARKKREKNVMRTTTAGVHVRLENPRDKLPPHSPRIRFPRFPKNFVKFDIFNV